MAESEGETPRAPATPGTPGTPGAPLFSSHHHRIDSLSYDRKSMGHCGYRCFSVDCWVPHSLRPLRLPQAQRLPHPQAGSRVCWHFILIFFATAAPIVNQKYESPTGLVGNAGCADLAVMIVILATGHISGAHLNPAVTISFDGFRHFLWAHVPAYIMAQISASICASFALKAIFHPFLSGVVTVPTVGLAQAFLLEFVISFNLMWGSWQALQ